MTKKFMSISIPLIIAGIFFYIGYEPEPYEIDISGTFFGYHIQTSQYTIYGLLIVLFTTLFSIFKFFAGLKNIYSNIVYFFTGRNKDKATENILNAYAHIIGKKPKSAQTYLKKAEKYFKNSPHTALIKLVIEQSQNQERPTSQAIATIENNKLLRPIGLYCESLYPVSKKDDKRQIELLKEAKNFEQSPTILFEYLSLLIKNTHYNEAETVIKSVRTTLKPETYKFHYASILLLKAKAAYMAKDISQMLALSLEALKHFDTPIAVQYIMHAYKTLQRNNKGERILNDYFERMPTINNVKFFLELKSLEETSVTAKRIAALPRTHVNSEAFMALQTYHFAIARDFISLNTAINNASNYHASLWTKAAKLCLAVEKDPILVSEALDLFKDALHAQCNIEISEIYQQHQLGLFYQSALMIEDLMRNISISEVSATLNLFKKMLKSIPILHQNKPPQTEIDNNDLYQIEGNIHKKK